MNNIEQSLIRLEALANEAQELTRKLEPYLQWLGNFLRESDTGQPKPKSE